MLHCTLHQVHMKQGPTHSGGGTNYFKQWGANYRIIPFTVDGDHKAMLQYRTLHTCNIIVHKIRQSSSDSAYPCISVSNHGEVGVKLY